MVAWQYTASLQTARLMVLLFIYLIIAAVCDTFGRVDDEYGGRPKMQGRGGGPAGGTDGIESLYWRKTTHTEWRTRGVAGYENENVLVAGCDTGEPWTERELTERRFFFNRGRI